MEHFDNYQGLHNIATGFKLLKNHLQLIDEHTIDKNKIFTMYIRVNILIIDLSCNSWQILFHQGWGQKMQPVF